MKYSFPDNFLWGAASSACQIEAACATDGKVENVFDHYSRVYPEKFANATPDDEVDFYHRFPEDIQLMKKLGLKMFRFSISWARIYSSVDGPVNQKGIDYYNRMIDCLVENGIVPFFDLFHCDLPMFVVDAGGPANPDFPAWFERYARTCFAAFGDRIQYWSTMNEPSINIFGAFCGGTCAPYLTGMDTGMQACFHMMLGHYRAVRAYREMGLKGKIGSVNHFEPVYPETDSDLDRVAADRCKAYYSGIWLEPIVYGRYPKIVTDIPYVAEHLPENYAERLAEEFAPSDFLGINYYNPNFARWKEDGKLCYETFIPDHISKDAYGFACYPRGIYDAVHYLKEYYGDMEIVITENGYGSARTGDLAVDADDPYRAEYMQIHLRELCNAIKDGVNVSGYCCWTILDTYEGGAGGYLYNFGLIQVDYKTLERTPRKSFYAYQKIIEDNGLN
ncbi:MAG: family 1 glycosylhydrolase [Oscillospiraceae bacterium]|nr:family 1 glycosylhydrolase [Oscillospiraceae bacterium]